MSKVAKLTNANAFGLLQVLRSVNDLQLVVSADPTFSPRRIGQVLNNLEDEVKEGLGEYAVKLDQVIFNAEKVFQEALKEIPEERRKVEDPDVQKLLQAKAKAIEDNALILGITPKAEEVCEITFKSDDRAKWLNAALDLLSKSWTDRKAFVKTCEAMDEALK